MSEQDKSTAFRKLSPSRRLIEKSRKELWHAIRACARKRRQTRSPWRSFVLWREQCGNILKLSHMRRQIELCKELECHIERSDRSSAISALVRGKEELGINFPGLQAHLEDLQEPDRLAS